MNGPFARYERARYGAVLVMHALTVAALWGQWRRIALLVAIAAATVVGNVALYRAARRSGRAEHAGDAKNWLNGLVGVACGHLCGWPLPLWLFLPFNALRFGTSRPTTRGKLAVVGVGTGGVAAADGVPLLVVACVAAMTAIVHLVAELRDAVLALHNAELGAANAALAEAQEM